MDRRCLLPLFALPLLAGTSLVAACSSSGNSSNAAADETTDSCTATFTWWQKDAYKSSGGRSDPLWPPHTTTEVQINCAGTIVSDTSMTNHGTVLGAVNDAGAPMLTNVKTATATGSQAELMSLVSTYQSCACDPAEDGGPGTIFLSADSPPSPAMVQILTSAATYVSQNLQCPGNPATSDVVSALESGNFDAAATAMAQCSWADGMSFEQGLEQAATSVLAQDQQTLDGFHVCNNDATLQANLFASFASSGAITACDPTTSVCAGPKFFYNP